jgi:hypothetical protein
MNLKRTREVQLGKIEGVATWKKYFIDTAKLPLAVIAIALVTGGI